MIGSVTAHFYKGVCAQLLDAGIKQFLEDCNRCADHARDQFLREIKARRIALGMIKEEYADLLQSVNGPYHPNIERTRKYFAKKKAEEQQLAKKDFAYEKRCSDRSRD